MGARLLNPLKGLPESQRGDGDRKVAGVPYLGQGASHVRKEVSPVSWTIVYVLIGVLFGYLLGLAAAYRDQHKARKRKRA